MSGFKNYLQNKPFKSSTIKKHTNNISNFLIRINKQGLRPEEVKYSDILAFIEHLREQHKSIENQNRYLLSIRHYYNFLDINSNPAEGIILKGTKRPVPGDLLDEKDLNMLYENHPDHTITYKRNKVITGLLVYQAITREELKKLETRHILLNKAKIIIPPGGKSNQRTLPINALQISELQNYIQKIRPKLLKQSKLKTDKLFFGSRHRDGIRGILPYLFKTLNKIHPDHDIKNIKHIRKSVIRNKLKTMNLREVQYFAGHKYVRSTERYQLGNIEDLKKQVNKYHPLQ